MADEISKIKNIDKDLENLVRDHVVSELYSAHGFIRMRACIIIQKFTRDSFDLELLKKISDGVTKCMADKENLPVRSNGAKALERLLKQPELMQHFLPHLKEILTNYLQLINEFESDSLIESLKGIFEIYSDVIGPYAGELIQNLTELFLKLHEKEKKLDKTSNATEDFMDAGFAVQACLVAISEILHAKIDQQTLLQVYEQIEPILLISLHEDGLDFMPDTCAIINMIIFKTDTITEKMWQLFPLYCYVMTAKPTIDLNTIQHQDYTIVEYFKNIYATLGTDDYGSEMIADIAPVLKNFMSKGKDTFMQRAGFCGVSYLQIMFGMVSKVIKTEIESMDEVHYVHAFMLVGHFFSCYTYDEISSYYPECLKLCIDYMLKKDTPTMRNVFLNNIGVALYKGRTKV